MISIIGNEFYGDDAKATKPVTAAVKKRASDANDLTSLGLVGFENSGDLTPLDTLFSESPCAKAGRSK